MTAKKIRRPRHVPSYKKHTFPDGWKGVWEAAQALSIPINLIYALLRNGRLKGQYLDGWRVIHEDEIERYKRKKAVA